MAKTGSVTVRISDEQIKERVREYLAQAWSQGASAMFGYFQDEQDWLVEGKGSSRPELPQNPYHAH